MTILKSLSLVTMLMMLVLSFNVSAQDMDDEGIDTESSESMEAPVLPTTPSDEDMEEE